MSRREVGLQFGDSLLLLAMLVWLTVSVGPWYLGVSMFLSAALINFVVSRR